MLKRLSLYLAVAFMALAVGCAQMGVATPDTFNKNLAVSVAVNQSIRDTATALLQAGKITSADAQNVQKQANVAREGLDVARALSGTDLTSAIGRVQAINAGLNALQTYLAAKQGAIK